MLALNIRRLIGDGTKTIGYNETIDNKTAQKIADMLCSKMNWNKVKISFSKLEHIVYTKEKKEPRHIAGEFLHSKNEILLHKDGENIGTLLHELAHYNVKRVHNNRFKQNQKKLITLYLEHIR